MHDLHEANRIQKLVLEKAAANKFKKVTQIVVALGRVLEHGALITKENLEFNLRMLNQGTIADGAEIIISVSPNEFWKLISISGE